MRASLLLLSLILPLASCINVERSPEPSRTTVVVPPQGSSTTVVCPNGQSTC